MNALNAAGDNYETQNIEMKDNISFEPESGLENETKEIVTEDTERVAKGGNEIENNLKDRIKQCRNIIESLKMELHQEKIRLENESRSSQHTPEEPKETITQVENLELDPSCPADLYSYSVESKLTCDENLMQYEKQLQRYQNTLNMAQIEKRNAIRKQMITKAYKLKLLEVENQCNIELLRVKQSLQCLEPLKIIANKWKTSTDDYDLDTFELMPRYPELNAVSGSDVSSLSDPEIKNKPNLALD